MEHLHDCGVRAAALAQVANVDSLVVAAIDIAPEATMLTAIELLRSFAMAALQHQVRVVGG